MNTRNKVTISKKKKVIGVCFFPLGNGLESPHSEGDLLIYSLLPWSQRFVNTASTIQEHINTQGRSIGLAGQPEPNPNK